MTGDQHDDVLTQDFVRPEAEQLFGGRIPVRDATVERGRDDGVRRGPDNGRQFRLGSRSPALIGDIADGRDHQSLAVVRDWRQTDVDRELAPVTTTSRELQARAHGPALRVGYVRGAMVMVAPANTFGNERLDREPGQRTRQIAEEVLGVFVHRYDASLGVRDHRRVRNERHHRAEQFGGDGACVLRRGLLFALTDSFAGFELTQ